MEIRSQKNGKEKIIEEKGKCEKKNNMGIILAGFTDKMENDYNPMSKEFQEDAKRLGLTGYQL